MSIKSQIPNTITCCNLIAGAMAVIAAFNSSVFWHGLQGYQWAFILIGAAAVFDFCDGFAARLLHAYSNLGKELDSLCDLVSFGVAPAMLVFNMMIDEGNAGWLSWFSIFIAVMGALRLAKFNIDDRQTSSFIGLPIPANAIFWIGCIAWIHAHGYPGHGPVLLLILVVSLLMVSGLRMFSLKFKTWGWRDNFRRYVLIASAILFVVTDGVPGLAWTIAFYVLLSLMLNLLLPVARD
mgnify:CR=1 FL=1